jgi:hypothetical protein
VVVVVIVVVVVVAVVVVVVEVIVVAVVVVVEELDSAETIFTDVDSTMDCDKISREDAFEAIDLEEFWATDELPDCVDSRTEDCFCS